jgi:hypothetical protein
MGNKHITLDESKPKSLFIDRNSSYAVNCKTGYQGNYHNAHHAVPCTSIQKSLKTYLDKKPPEYNKALARFTKWDVNSEPNLVGLPHKHAYELAYKQVLSAILDLLRPQWKMAAVAIPGAVKYPIHLPTSWGHVTYNKLVETQLDMIWKRLNVTVKEHEPINATDMGSMIQAVSDAFRGLLTAKVFQTEADWKANRKSPQFMMI